jgi:hypothetical protein
MSVKKVQTKSAVKYDSLQNYLGSKVFQYVGQELYLKPLPESLRTYGYDEFFTSIDDGFKTNGENVYKCCQSFNSLYDELEGKYFQVLEVIKHPRAEADPVLYATKYFLQLKEKESGDTCYFKYDANSIEEVFPFVVVGYFEKAKKKYIGRTYITKGKNWVSKTEPMIDIVSGKNVSVAVGKVWKCIDFTIEDKFYELALILQSGIGEKVALSVVSLKGGYFAYEKR